MSKVEWRVVEEPEKPDHPWPTNNPQDYCVQCGRSWLDHDGNTERILDQMAKAWP